MICVNTAPEEIQFVEKDEHRARPTRFAKGDFVVEGDPIVGGETFREWL
jgi:hypothetical protein